MKISNNHAELQRVNLMVSADVLRWLDETVAQLRADTGANLSRSGLIRGIICGFAIARVGVHRCRSEDEIATVLAIFLRR